MKTMSKGVLYTIIAYTLWGLLPVYWKMLSPILSIHVLAARIVFSFVFVAFLLAILNFQNKQPIAWLDAIRNQPFSVISSGIIVSLNWGLYIFAVQSGRTIQASLGYYINPLVSILLGLIVLKERLLVLQWIAVALAALGVGILTVFAGTFPWISLALAFSFGFYGLLKKKMRCGSLAALGAETFASLPLALLLVLLPWGKGIAYIPTTPLPVIIGIILAGPITAIPLYFFAQGAKILPLSLLGFITFIQPTLQLFSGVFLLGEPFPLKNIIPFSLIWVSAIVFMFSYIPQKRTLAKKT